MNAPRNKGLARTGVTGVYWCDESDLEGRTDVRARQRAGQGVLRDRRPRRPAASGAQQGRRPHPVPADLRDRRRGRAVPDIDKAYDDGERTVVLTKDDLASLPAESSREIDVVEFVPSEQVDLLTLDRAYYLEPDSASPKAYVLLRKTLEQTDRTAIVRFSLRQKTRLAALRVRGDVLVLQTLLWADEVREAAFPALDEPVRISAKELELSASLVESFASGLRSRASSRTSTRTSCAPSSRRSSRRATRSTPPRPSASRRKRPRAARSSTSWRRCARASSAVARRASGETKAAAPKSTASKPPRSRAKKPAAKKPAAKKARREEEACEGVLSYARGQTVGARRVGGARGRGRRPRGRARGASASSGR